MTTALLLMGGAVSSAQNQTFSLKGTINGHEGGLIYICYSLEGNIIKDSTKVAEGKFEFSGEMDCPYTMASLSTEYPSDSYSDRNPENYSYLYIEPTDISIALNVFYMDEPVVSGSRTMRENDELSQLLRDEQQFFAVYNRAAQSDIDSTTLAALDKLREEAGKSYGEKSLLFVQTHPDSYLSSRCLAMQMSDMTLDSLKMFYGPLSERVKAEKGGKEIADEIAARERIEPGNPAPLFSATDINGNEFSLESLRGKYVVLDFWASWCVPCRKSNPHMKELYAKYGSKGLDFVYISDDDSDPDKWRKAVETDGLEDFHHVLRGLKIVSRAPYVLDKSNDISDLYAIHYLPTKYLIDKEGNMVGKFESDELENKLKEIFGF